MEQLARERDANKVEKPQKSSKLELVSRENEITHNTLLRYGTV
jgi:hypothetical protein